MWLQLSLSLTIVSRDFDVRHKAAKLYLLRANIMQSTCTCVRINYSTLIDFDYSREYWIFLGFIRQVPTFIFLSYFHKFYKILIQFLIRIIYIIWNILIVHINFRIRAHLIRRNAINFWLTLCSIFIVKYGESLA